MGNKLFDLTPIGKIEIPEWEAKPLFELSDGQLIQKAIAENDHFCISPATYAMIEKRGLGRALQHQINPNVGMNHNTLRYISELSK